MDQGSAVVAFIEQIYHILREDIINRMLTGGDQLTVGSLQERFQLSSTTIQVALDKLEGEGLVERISYEKIRVVLLGEKEIGALYDSMLKLDFAALKQACLGEKASVEDFSSALSINVELMSTAFRFGDTENFLMHSDHFHNLFYIYSDNKELCASAKKIRGRFSILASQLQSNPEARARVLGEHGDIARAVADGEYDAACKLLTKHMERGKTEMLEAYTVQAAGQA